MCIPSILYLLKFISMVDPDSGDSESGSGSESEGVPFLDASSGGSGEDPTARACSPEIESCPAPPSPGPAPQRGSRQSKAYAPIAGPKAQQKHSTGKHKLMVNIGCCNRARPGAHFLCITANPVREPGKERSYKIQTGCSPSLEPLLQRLDLEKMVPWSLMAAAWDRQQARTVHKPAPVSGLPHWLLAVAVRLGLMEAIHACSRRYPWNAGPAAAAAALAEAAAEAAGGLVGAASSAAAAADDTGREAVDAAAAAAVAGSAGPILHSFVALTLC